MSKSVSLENTRLGGFGLPGGPVIPGNGLITIDSELWATAKDHPVVKAMVDSGAILVDGKGRSKLASDEKRDENGDTAEMAEMRKRFEISYGEIADRLEAAEKAVTDRNAEIADLRGQLEAAKAANSAAPLKAEHHGGGRFNVTKGEDVLLSGLSKVDADAFNAMSDADKAVYVEKNKAS